MFDTKDLSQTTYKIDLGPFLRPGKSSFVSLYIFNKSHLIIVESVQGKALVYHPKTKKVNYFIQENLEWIRDLTIPHNSIFLKGVRFRVGKELSLFTFNLLTKKFKDFKIENGMLYLNRRILDGDRFIGISSKEGYPVLKLTHPLSKAELSSLHLVNQNLKIEFLELNKLTKFNSEQNSGFWSNIKTKFILFKESNNSQKWVYPKHPFMKYCSTPKEIDHIHYSQKEGILILCKDTRLMFFQISWSIVQYLGTYKL